MVSIGSFAAVSASTSQPEPPGRPKLIGPGDRALGAIPPTGLVLLSIVSIQIGAAIATRLFPVFGPAGTVFWRTAFAAIILLTIFRPRLTGAFRSNLPLIALLGFVIAAMNLCFYQAISRIPLGTAVTIEFLGPLAVALAASRKLRDLLWICLASGGLWMMMPEIGTRLDIAGVSFAALAGLGWAGFILVSRRTSRRLEGNSGLAFAMAVAATLTLPFAAGGLADSHLDLSALTAAFAVAVLSTAVPLSLEYAALRRLSPRAYAILVTLEPAVASIIGVVLLDQAMPLRAIAAVAAITIAAIGVTLLDQAPPTDNVI